jgi:hypothetical protein
MTRATVAPGRQRRRAAGVHVAGARVALAAAVLALLAACQPGLPEPWPTPTEPALPEPFVGARLSNIVPVPGMCLANNEWVLETEDTWDPYVGYVGLEVIDCLSMRALFTITEVGPTATKETCENDLFWHAETTSSGVPYCLDVVLSPNRCFPYRENTPDELPDTTGIFKTLPIPCDIERLPDLTWHASVTDAWAEQVAKITSDRGPSQRCKMYIYTGDNKTNVWCFTTRTLS